MGIEVFFWPIVLVSLIIISLRSVGHLHKCEKCRWYFTCACEDTPIKIRTAKGFIERRTPILWCLRCDHKEDLYKPEEEAIEKLRQLREKIDLD